MKRQKALNRELTKLEAELDILQKERAAKSLAPEFAQTLGKKYTDPTYENVLNDKIERLKEEIARIQQSLPTGQLQPFPK
jgi:predicted  nucleic acid-binding Zn-ribbon protein